MGGYKSVKVATASPRSFKFPPNSPSKSVVKSAAITAPKRSPLMDTSAARTTLFMALATAPAVVVLMSAGRAAPESRAVVQLASSRAHRATLLAWAFFAVTHR